MTPLPSRMRALRLRAWGELPELVEVPVPVPSGEELLLRVEAVGLCHSDLHIMDAAPGDLPYDLPFTLGHEVVGTVVAVGNDELTDWVGESTAVHGIWSCGECRACRRGRENYCAALTGAIGGGIGRDGGLADYILVPHSRHLVRAFGADPVGLAPLTDAALTAQNALRPHHGLVPGAVVVVVGVGGLGHLALQLVARSRPHCVIAVDPRPEARDLAQRLGADVVVSSVEEMVTCLDEHSEGNGADLVLDFVGSQETMDGGVVALAPGGQFVLVGSAGGHIDVTKGGVLPRGVGITAPFWGTRADLEDVVALAAEGGLSAETESHGLDQALVAYERLRAGRVRGRAVVVPGAQTRMT